MAQDRQITADAEISTVAFSAEGQLLAGICRDGKLRQWDVRSGALRRTLGWLAVFYLGGLAIVVGIVPWTEIGLGQSPFVRVFADSGIRHAAGIMNFVVLTAALSSMNTNVYLCSRMLFSLSRARYAPRFVGSDWMVL